MTSPVTLKTSAFSFTFKPPFVHMGYGSQMTQ